jgi:DNA polymerase-1
LDLTAWARRVLGEVAKEMPDDELAVLEGQVRTLTLVEAASAPLPPDPTAPTVVRDRKSLKQVAARLEAEPEVVIDLETSTLDPHTGEVVGVGLSAADANFYVPTAHRFEDSKQLRPDQLPVDVVARELRLGKLPLVAHNAKFEFRWLRRHAGVACNFIWDVMLAARLLASHLPAELKNLAERELDVSDWSLTREEIKKVQFLPVERVARYCSKDCYYTLQLYRRQRACLS